MSLDPIPILKVLALLTLANGTPVLAKRLMGARGSAPIDCGVVLADGRPLLGRSKTWRGLVLAIAATAGGAAAVGLDWQHGVAAGAAAMAGDLISSFTKRRLGIASSSKATGLDQIPEALLPALVSAPVLGLGALDVAAIVLLFLVGEIVLSRVAFRLRIRDKPY